MKKIIAAAALTILTITSASAQEFFDTSVAQQFFNLGARVGFNTSNRTFPKEGYENSIITTWGTGFNAGVVANLNFREYLSLQPGLFFESRSGNLVNHGGYDLIGAGGSINKVDLYGVAHRRDFYFTIPVMGIVKFNLAENIKWNVEFGPYLQFLLKETGEQNETTLYRYTQNGGLDIFTPQHKSFDFGFKMGTGLTVYEHYYIGVHYLAGVCDAWKIPSGGRNKSWMFTIGYDF